MTIVSDYNRNKIISRIRSEQNQDISSDTPENSSVENENPIQKTETKKLSRLELLQQQQAELDAEKEGISEETKRKKQEYLEKLKADNIAKKEQLKKKQKALQKQIKAEKAKERKRREKERTHLLIQLGGVVNEVMKYSAEHREVNEGDIERLRILLYAMENNGNVFSTWLHDKEKDEIKQQDS